MGFFLLGIPLAIASGVMLSKDVKYTAMNIKIPKASFQLNEQIRQIDEFLFDIFDYVGVEGDIDKRTRTITNTEYNGYNGLDRYLAEKGYRKEAIDYAIQRYNEIAKKESNEKLDEREKRIRDYEWKLKNEKTYYDTWESSIAYYHTQKQVEHKVEQLLDYLKTHEQEDAYCNIIMGGKAKYHNHTEVWHLKVPYSATNKETKQYLKDIYEKVIGDD